MSELAKLKLWTDGVETYVAENAEQARQMQIDMIGEESASPLPDWGERISQKPLKIYTDDGRGEVEKTLQEWISENGPGFLCSTDW